MGCILRNLKALLCGFARVLPERACQALGRVGFLLGQLIDLDQRVECAGGGRAVAGRHQRQVSLFQQALLDQFPEQRCVEEAPGSIGLFGRQIARVDHGGQNLALAAVRVAGRLERIQTRILGDSGEDCHLVQREIRSGLVVINLCCGLDAVGRVSIEVIVDVPLQDLLFAFAAGILAGDLDGQDGFFHLACVRLFIAFLGVDEDVLDQLLRDGARALHAVAAQVRDKRAREAAQVHADVGVEVAILQRDGGILDQRRYLVGRQIGAVPAEGARIDRLVQQMLTGAVVDLDRLIGFLLGLDRTGVGQILREERVDARSRDSGPEDR